MFLKSIIELKGTGEWGNNLLVCHYERPLSHYTSPFDLLHVWNYWLVQHLSKWHKMNVREQMLHSYKSVYYLVVLCFVFSYFFIVHSLMVCVIPSCVCYLFRSLQGNQACKMFSLYKIKEKKNLRMIRRNIATSFTQIQTQTHTQRMQWSTIWKEWGGGIHKVTAVGLFPEGHWLDFSEQKQRVKKSKRAALPLPHSYHHDGTDWMLKECGFAERFPGNCTLLK